MFPTICINKAILCLGSNMEHNSAEVGLTKFHKPAYDMAYCEDTLPSGISKY
jgi:hypothetical protein